MIGNRAKNGAPVIRVLKLEWPTAGDYCTRRGRQLESSVSRASLKSTRGPQSNCASEIRNPKGASCANTGCVQSLECLSCLLPFPFALAQKAGQSGSTEAQKAAPADLSGFWLVHPPASATAYSSYAFTKENPPMTPWAEEKFKAAKPVFGPSKTTRNFQTILFTDAFRPACRASIFIRSRSKLSSCRMKLYDVRVRSHRASHIH